MPMNPKFDDDFHIKIEPVKNGINRPLWSVVIPTFNCANFLRETLKSVLSQGYILSQMEIIVVDDCSTKDDPKSVVEEFKVGRISFYRQEHNVGKSQNYSKGLSMTTGYYIHLLHGDDSVNIGFYSKIETLLTKFPETSVAFCRCNYINSESSIVGETGLLLEQDGILEDFQDQITTWQLVQPPSIVFKRTVYETLGTYDLRLKYIEDWEFYVRVAVFFKFAYTPKKLANYRVFAENSSSLSIKGGKRVSTIAQVFSIIDDYLPHTVRKKINHKRNRAASVYLLNFIPKLVTTKDFKGLMVTTRAFSIYNRDLHLWGRWMRFLLTPNKFL
jgi:glycosyltransferase involved in cell wall biosynthesis